MSNQHKARTTGNKQRKASAKGVSRRQFLNTAAVGAGSLALAGKAWAQEGPKPGRVLGANDRVVMAIIGAGGMGKGHMRNFKKVGGMEWAAVCDVYEPHREEGLKLAGKKAKGYNEHEKVLERKDIDAVLIASPEHWHHNHLIAAVGAGKDAYSEKPMCHTLQEGQEMIDAVRKTKQIVQIGMQRRSSPTIRDKMKPIFESGKLGNIHLVQAEWYWEYKVDPNPKVDRDKLDWERFCGPAGAQDYDPVKYRSWRYYWPFSGGNETDQGTHLMDVVQWMMDVEKPKSAVQWGSLYQNKPTVTPDVFCCTFEYPNFMATWTLGYASARWRNGWSITFQGDKGSLFLTEDGYRLFNGVNGWEDGLPKPAEQDLPHGVTQTEPHIANFLDCVRTRKEPNAPVEIGFRAVRGLHLANAALHKGRQAILGDDGMTITYA